MSTATAPASGRPGYVRWTVCALLFFAITINYVDRQIIGVLKPLLSEQFGWSETDYGDIVFWFQTAYALGLLAFGCVLDVLGTRRGLTLAVGVWSLAAMAHAGASSVFQFAARFALGLGEAGGYPAAIKTVAEWFPQRERALVAGILNAGANVGAVVTPLLVPLLVLAFGWRAAFVVTGAMGLIWLLIWWFAYRKPSEHPRLDAAERTLIESDPIDPPGKVAWLDLSVVCSRNRRIPSGLSWNHQAAPASAPDNGRPGRITISPCHQPPFAAIWTAGNRRMTSSTWTPPRSTTRFW